MNLRAGEALAALGLADPAASRMYYALFQSAVHALRRRGLRPERLRSGAVHWDHAMVRNNVWAVRGRRSDRELLREMLDLRKLADYEDHPVDPKTVLKLIPAVREFVEEVAK